MRYLTLFCCLLAATTLDAQLLGGNETRTRNGWEISASFSPDLNKRPRLTGVRLERDPNDIPISQRPFNTFDTINIAGQDRIFNRVPSFGFSTRPTSSNLWFGANITAHRRIGTGLDISAGLFYNQAQYTIGAENRTVHQGVVSTFTPLIYNLEATRQRAFGVSLRANYHLFAKARLHPYFGMGVNLYHYNRTRITSGRAYSGETLALLPTTPAQVLTENSTQLLDFVATAGLLFRITDAWSVGLDITSRPFTGPGLVGVQVRRGL